MNDYNTIFERFWSAYIKQNPLALRISDLFKAEGEQVAHDHIALRTFNLPKVSVDKVAQILINAGYEPKNDYVFEQKHLQAKHFEHKTVPHAPKVFISELEVEKFSPFLQEVAHKAVESIPDTLVASGEFVFGERLWGTPSFETYNELREESEYAAWLYVHGYRANHFAIHINSFSRYDDIRKVNNFVKENGYMMNIVNELETYGSADELLEQSSTKAEIVKIDFLEGTFEVPACFYEFTQRYPQANGELYGGFIAASADKIFQSTDFYVLKSSDGMQ